MSKRLRQILPWIPIVGIPLTGVYHCKYGDTGIEDFGLVFFLSGIVQSVSGLLIIYFISL